MGFVPTDELVEMFDGEIATGLVNDAEAVIES